MFSPLILGILIFCNFIMAFTNSIAAKPHNYVIVENTFPADKIDDPKVLAFRKNYQKRQFQLAFILTILDLILLIPMKDSIFMMLFFVLLYITIAAGYLLQIRYIRKGHQLIIENNWQLTEQPIQVNTALVIEKNRKLVSPWWFVVSFGLLLLLTFVLHNQGMESLTWILFITCGLTLALFVVGWWAIGRLPVRALTDDQTINRQYNDLTKFYWSALMVTTSFFVNLVIYLPLLTVNLSNRFFEVLMISEFLLIFLFCGLTFWWLFRLRNKQDQLLTQTPSFRYTGDDYYWRYGIYYNPDDRRLMIPDRIGLNITINLARVGGKIFIGLIPILLIAAMLIVVVPLYVLDYHPDPLTYEVKQESVLLDGPYYREQKISFQDIEKVSLIEQLPPTGMKVNGLATENYAIGSFKVGGKSATLFIDHQSKPILKITTKKRDYYYTNTDSAVTKQAYQSIQARK
ncbi:PH domain-containing protein [Enterococcus raffinosus]|uniref:PH domain-containing protein n=1 Tax=Enterococcus raffinosus TaxID=71452 RepID=A0AAW8TC21_9ENTE|nr:PH domain-containing protein [Enterococcus raffinosus]MDT2521764.1 PH domain-containing protein [Enterococcus raffinosus]MDT2529073.1 PH domain-containing protein [Enterococcus raffinosus]MDT2532721.1 PH domain-containing protein [Enterococcus raffinosus]MDT2544412.1 PH domain-containing protein [Enterococcus raffinosus]MDT2554702.1 PH domain-containing protein [Enterococcus raffinosus]